MFIIFSISFSFFLFYNNNLAPQCGRPHNNGLYRRQLDCLSDTNLSLCFIIFIIQYFWDFMYFTNFKNKIV